MLYGAVQVDDKPQESKMCMANLANDVSSVSSKRDVGHTVRPFRGPWEAGQLAKLRQDDNDMAKIQSKCWPRQTLKVSRRVLLVETQETQETQEPQVQCLQIASNCLAQICLTSRYIKCCKKVSSSSTMQRFFSKMIGVLQKHHKSPQASQI